MSKKNMYLRFKYSNDTPPFEKDIPRVKGWDAPIFELKIAGSNGRTKQAATNDYIVSLVYGFRDLINKHETDIDEFELGNFFIGTLTKTKDYVCFRNFEGEEDTLAKYGLIVFNLYKDLFNEKLYFTRNEDILAEGQMMFSDHLINDGLIQNKEKRSRRFIDSLITAVACNFSDYDITMNEKTKKIEYTYKGVPLESIEDIKDDDVFVFFKLIEVLLVRGKHRGIYFLDCEFLSAEVINALVAFINLYYLNNRIVFLYNVPSSKRSALKDIPREVVVLPNHKYVNKKK